VRGAWSKKARALSLVFFARYLQCDDDIMDEGVTNYLGNLKE